ncbi:MAG: AI-2E family transporter [Akkermansiaceae bacterium]|nr:AI-2E family transporter [Akkermansiaceae bacterium]
MESNEHEEAASRSLLGKLKLPTPGTDLVGLAQVGLFVIVLFYVLHEMKPVLLPLVLAILVSMIVHPIYLVFRKMRIPRLLSSLATVAGLTAITAFGAYQSILPGAQWLRNMDETEVLERMQDAFRPVKVVQAEIELMADRVEEATNKVPVEVSEEIPKVEKPSVSEKLDEMAADVSATDPKVSEKQPEERKAIKRTRTEMVSSAPMQVEIHEDSVSLLLKEAKDFGFSFVAFLLLVLFILAYGTLILEQLNRKERVRNILSRVGNDVSKYMSTITLINIGLGVCVGLAMWGLGMPRPVLWGIMATVLNFVPYIGALAGTFVVFLAAAINFQDPGKLIAVPLIYFALTAIEGNMVTPMVLGGRFRINPLVVFVWIFAWAGFWGISGILIAMPALVIFKIFCENTEKMKTVRRVLSA